MKIIVEASAYLVILSFICLISLDFIAVNKSVSKGSEVQQYIKELADNQRTQIMQLHIIL